MFLDGFRRRARLPARIVRRVAAVLGMRLVEGAAAAPHRFANADTDGLPPHLWDTAAWSLEQDGQLCQLAQWLAARQGVAPRELRAADFDAAMANQGGRFGTLRAQSTAAMPARCGALLALNTAVTERLLPWVDLRAVATPGSLAAMVCAIKA